MWQNTSTSFMVSEHSLAHVTLMKTMSTALYLPHWNSSLPMPTGISHYQSHLPLREWEKVVGGGEKEGGTEGRRQWFGRVGQISTYTMSDE